MSPRAGLTVGGMLCALLLSCSGTGQAVKREEPLPPGVVHRKIPVAADSTQSYALYLPAVTPFAPAGDTGKPVRYPVIIAFDPHGDGGLPVSLYRELAGRYGFILAGSNDSRNGLPAERTGDIALKLIREIRSYTQADTTRIWLLGFSGGARVASLTAMYLAPVRGIIGCGAGLPAVEQPPRYRFDYIGLAGTADFNMHEVTGLEETFRRAGFRHLIGTFPGKHAWPPVEVMEDAFRQILLFAMKDRQTGRNDSIVRAAANRYRERAATLKTSGDLLGAAGVLRWAVSSLDGLDPGVSFQDELTTLESSPEFRRQEANRRKSLEQEETDKEEFLRALQDKDMAWWARRMAGYSARSQVSEDTLMKARVLGFLSLYCYMNATATMSRNDEHAAVKIVSVYSLCDPGNPEPDYLQAVLHARRGDGKEARNSVLRAIGKGFSDRQRLLHQPEFREYAKTPGWADLINSLR